MNCSGKLHWTIRLADMASGLERLLSQERLPASYTELYDTVVLPCAAEIAARQSTVARTILIGLNGTQGSGKSTMAKFLVLALAEKHGLNAVILSLDDIYLTKAERQKLAVDVHPLLATRGAPGTHDIALAHSIVEQLQSAMPNSTTPLPQFDKSRDDRCPSTEWHVCNGRPEVILLEGWCVASPPQTDAELVEPLNVLERIEDGDGRWRHYVNAKLAGPYGAFFQLIDTLVMLNAPSFEAVLEWRTQQEEKLAERMRETGGDITALSIMSSEELARFLLHFERITRHSLQHLPQRADIRVDFDAGRNVRGLSIRKVEH
jgi:D-glycerate 3-kinase